MALLTLLQDALAVVFLVEVVLRHKVCVMRAALWMRRRGVMPAVTALRLLKHDLSKFSAAELLPYARHYARHNAGISLVGRLFTVLHVIHPQQWDDPIDTHGEFATALQHHYDTNEHHVSEHYAGSGGSARAPDGVVVEMVADWFAAEKGYFGKWPEPPDAWPWLGNQLPIMLRLLHPANGALVCVILRRLGFGSVVDSASRSSSN